MHNYRWLLHFREISPWKILPKQSSTLSVYDNNVATVVERSENKLALEEMSVPLKNKIPKEERSRKLTFLRKS